MRRIFWLVLIAAFLAGFAGCSCRSEKGEGEGTGKKPLDLSYITSDCFAAWITHPRRIGESPLVASVSDRMPFRHPIADLVALRFPPGARNTPKIEQQILLAAPAVPEEPRPGDTPFVPTVVLRFAEPVDQKQLLSAMFRGDAVEATWKGKTYYNFPREKAAAYFPDHRTMVVSVEKGIRKIISAKTADSPLIKRLLKLDANNDVIGVVVLEGATEQTREAAGEAARAFLPQVAELVQAPEYLDAATLTANLAGDPLIEVTLEAKDAESAAKLEELAKRGSAALRQKYAPRPSMPMAGSPEKAESFGKLVDQLGGGIKVSKQADRVVVRVARPESMDQFISKFRPKMDTGRELAKRPGRPDRPGRSKYDYPPKRKTSGIADVVKAAERANRMNNLHQIGLAMLNHESRFGRFPAAASGDKPGQPPVSWRVRLLPYLDGSALYEEYRRDEPWDSPYNRRLVDRMPEVYRGQGRGYDGKTTIMVFTGEGTAFGEERGPRVAQIRDGTSNTIMVVEAGVDKAVPWTKPEDLAFEPDNPARALGYVPTDGFLAVFFDCSVRMINKYVEPETLRRLIDPNDGHAVDLDRRD